MSTSIENRTEAWQRRAALSGEVDFTMMYIAHDAFNRDLHRLVSAARSGKGLTEAAVSTWRGLAKQLHTHHNAEDKALWPRLATAVTDSAERQILEDMEMEHASLDPGISRVSAAIEGGDETALTAELLSLAAGLSTHMIHEETSALPLLERRLGQAGWDAFGKEIREQRGGIKGAAEYLPWVLDGASEEVQAKVLHMLPAPARLLYKRVWAPGYRKSNRLR